MRGTAQNPDVYFQGRETVNTYLCSLPGHRPADYGQVREDRRPTVQAVRIRRRARRRTRSSSSRAPAPRPSTRPWTSSCASGEKVGVIKVRLYRPFSVKHLHGGDTRHRTRIAVLDRTKEPGSLGEPLYLDVIAAIEEGIAAGTAPVKSMPLVVGGRFGLGSKEFTPAMAKAVFDNLDAAKPHNHFSVGIEDDVTGNSPRLRSELLHQPTRASFRAMFYGLGSDGTVGANKNSIKIIGDETDNYAQGYFVYDSKKAGSVTVSHLRFGKNPIRSPYLIDRAELHSLP